MFIHEETPHQSPRPAVRRHPIGRGGNDVTGVSVETDRASVERAEFGLVVPDGELDQRAPIIAQIWTLSDSMTTVRNHTPLGFDTRVKSKLRGHQKGEN